MKNILCDHKCPIHDKCARFLEGLNRLNTFHYDPQPYRNGKCDWFVEIDDEAIDKIKEIIHAKPKEN